jgi:hypothetical protein
VKAFLGVVLNQAGGGAAVMFGFGALMLGGGSSSQSGEAPLQLAGAVVGGIAAISGGSFLRACPDDDASARGS